MDIFEFSAILYQEDSHWIAQGLEFDITAQAPSLPELHKRFAMKIASEVAISLDLGKKPLENVGPAPEEFWRMFEGAKLTVDAESTPVRISDGAMTPRIIPHMKVGQLEASY